MGYIYGIPYNSQIWFPSQKMLDKLELFQKRATQWILDIEDYHQRLRALKLSPISYQLQMADLTFLNKLLNERYEVDVSTIINTKRPSAYDLRRVAVNRSNFSGRKD